MGPASADLGAGSIVVAAHRGAVFPPFRSRANSTHLREGWPKLDRQNSKSFQTIEPARGCAHDGPESRRLIRRRDVDRCRAHFYALSVRVRRVCRDYNRELLRTARRDFADRVCGARSHRLRCRDTRGARRNDGQRALNLASARKLCLVEAWFHVPAQFPSVRCAARPDDLAWAACVCRSHLRRRVRCLDVDGARCHDRESKNFHRWIPDLLVRGRERARSESDVGFRRLLRSLHYGDHLYLRSYQCVGDWICAVVLSRAPGANIKEQSTTFIFGCHRSMKSRIKIRKPPPMMIWTRARMDMTR